MTKKNCYWHTEVIQGIPCPEDCDFEDLEYEKEAILERVKQEAKEVEKIRDSLTDGDFSKKSTKEMLEIDSKMKEMMDKVAGINIMSQELKDNFEMSDSEIKKEIDVKKLSFGKKLKLVGKLASMRAKRKKGD